MKYVYKWIIILVRLKYEFHDYKDSPFLAEVYIFIYIFHVFLLIFEEHQTILLSFLCCCILYHTYACIANTYSYVICMNSIHMCQVNVIFKGYVFFRSLSWQEQCEFIQSRWLRQLHYTLYTIHQYIRQLLQEFILVYSTALSHSWWDSKCNLFTHMSSHLSSQLTMDPSCSVALTAPTEPHIACRGLDSLPSTWIKCAVWNVCNVFRIILVSVVWMILIVYLLVC